MTRRILLIDDDVDIHDLVGIGLEHSGWQVLHARTGHEGLALAREQQPDAVLLDYMMPGMAGPNLCRMLRSEGMTQHIPVVFLTALGLDPSILGEVGAAGVIQKPFSTRRLAKNVSQLLLWE